MCGLILRDEAGHVRVHRDRLAAAGRSPLGLAGALWQGQFWLCGHAAATLLWMNHGPCLTATRGSRAEYLQALSGGLHGFVTSLCDAGEPTLRFRGRLPRG